jgi:two-component system, LuxR family, sensor kinase FixL
MAWDGNTLSFGSGGYLPDSETIFWRKQNKDELGNSPLGHNWSGMTDLPSIYSPANRTRLLIVAGLLVTLIAALDWATKAYISLGFLYLFPIIIVGGFLSRTKIVVAAFGCALLQEAFSNLPENEALVRLILSSAGFIGTGLLISELIRNRRIVLQHVEELENEVRLRHDAEEQLQILVESSPAAIVTIDATGAILLANQAAQQLLAPSAAPLRGQRIDAYLPALQTAVESQLARSFRTTLQCKGQRSTGEAFLAGVWFSTYGTISGPRLAAVVVDLSDDLRDREDLSLDSLLKNSRILMSAVAHEVRNLCGAALVVHKNLSRFAELEHNQDFQALSTLIQSLERISALGVRSSPVDTAAPVELTSALDELRVLIEGVYHESGMAIDWRLASMPLVRADRYGLIQVFLNLARNSRRAMESTEVKRLSIGTAAENGTVVIRFEDTGTGVASPEDLFRPFQPGAHSTGLGLYVSRAIMRSFGGELLYEPRTQGCCFAVVVPSVPRTAGALDA